VLTNTDATKELVRYYANARFRLKGNDFESGFCDGTKDGGIDFFYIEDDTYYIFQSKFSATKSNTSEAEVKLELGKIEKTLTKTNTNTRAASFVNGLKLATDNDSVTLEVVWLTTKGVPEAICVFAQNELARIRRESGWKINVDFVPVDVNSLRAVVHDVKHGNVPYTGKRTVPFEDDAPIQFCDDATGVRCAIVTMRVVDLLRWFNQGDVERFLQKNVRGFMGENDVNRGIVKSFKENPEWFWYKHNGIIVFVDNYSVSAAGGELILRNPQIVNGGQTARSLYRSWDALGRKDSAAKVLMRIYRLPYESSEAYEKGIEIISALNSQTKIYASDLRSSDPRQVRIEELVNQLGYKYYRKRARENRATLHSITMRNLALLYYMVKKKSPHYGATGEIESLFKETAHYRDVFDEKEINKTLTKTHVVLRYISVWTIYQLLKRLTIPDRDENFRPYSQFCVVVDTYCKLEDWRRRSFGHDYLEWVSFLDSEGFKEAIMSYGRIGFRLGREIIPKSEEARSYYRTPAAFEKYVGEVSQRKFNSLIDKAYERFEEDLD